MSQSNQTHNATALYPAYVVHWTQEEYEAHKSAWGCLPRGMLFRITDGEMCGLFEGSGDPEKKDTQLVDAETLFSFMAMLLTAAQQS